MTTEKPSTEERANTEEQPNARERATIVERPIKGERAIAGEKPQKQERATISEKPNPGERARVKEKPKGVERVTISEKPSLSERPPLYFYGQAALSVERLRVACQVRIAHLAKSGRTDDSTATLLAKIADVESYVDSELARWVSGHPTWPWLSRIRGVGKENIPKVLYQLDITRADHVSSFWKFAGYAPGADKRKAGELNPYNARLRTMLYRLGTSFMRAKNRFYDYYLTEKATLAERPDMTPLHTHRMAFRKMMKLFLECLWLVWREAEGLPVSESYPVAHGHARRYYPGDFCDRSWSQIRRRRDEQDEIP